MRRIATIFTLAVLLVAATAWAQAEIRGTVSHIEVGTRTVYFTDGRIVQLKPGSTITINGQPAVFEGIRPGMALVVFPPAVVTATSAPPPAPVVSSAVTATPAVPATISATGTVARTDPLGQTITFQDGRIVRVTPQTMVWQQAPAISTLLPGAHVFVRDAVPVGYLPSGAAAPVPAGQYVLGTVARVEPANQEIVLSNGTVVRVDPTATVRVGTDRVAITRLRPGDEVVIQVRQPMTAAPIAVPGGTVATMPVPSAADRYAGSALPYQSYADTRIEAADVQVLWSPQAR